MGYENAFEYEGGKQDWMDAQENFLSPLLLYHLLSSDDNTTERSLRPVFAISTFASESVVREFTGSRKRFAKRVNLMGSISAGQHFSKNKKLRS